MHAFRDCREKIWVSTIPWISAIFDKVCAACVCVESYSLGLFHLTLLQVCMPEYLTMYYYVNINTYNNWKCTRLIELRVDHIVRRLGPCTLYKKVMYIYCIWKEVFLVSFHHLICVENYC